MEPINADEIQSFLQDYPSRTYSYGQSPYFDYGSDPRWAPPVTSDLLLDDADYSQGDAQSEYTTASTVTSRAYTMRSNAPSSIFSRRSQGASSAGQSSAPSVGVPHQTFLQQFGGPAGHGPAHSDGELWCEFSALKNCHATFRLDDEAGWIQHHVRHLEDNFPRQLMCWFCDHVPFVANRQAEALANFEERMQHIKEHIFGDHRLTSDDTRPDFHVVKHLYRHGLLDDAMYNRAMAYDETPAAYRLPGSHSSSSASPLGPQQAPPPQDMRQYYHELERERREHRQREREHRRRRRE